MDYEQMLNAQPSNDPNAIAAAIDMKDRIITIIPNQVSDLISAIRGGNEEDIKCAAIAISIIGPDIAKYSTSAQTEIEKKLSEPYSDVTKYWIIDSLLSSHYQGSVENVVDLLSASSSYKGKPKALALLCQQSHLDVDLCGILDELRNDEDRITSFTASRLYTKRGCDEDDSAKN